MLPELFILRHGETEWNRDGRWQGRLDSALTARGLAQARAMGALLRDMGLTGHRLVSSPQGRAMATARLVAETLQSGVEEDARLVEIDVGAWSGWRIDDIRAAAGATPTTDMLDIYAACPGGEGFPALFARVEGFLSDLRGPAIVVTHGLTSRFLRAAALGGGLDRVVALGGGQGVIHRLRDGRQDVLDPGPVDD